jgi:pimeloyl-ACP methyl ester carboxylesterase
MSAVTGSPMSEGARGHRWSSCTDMSAIDGHGAPRSKTCPTSSRWWRGMHRASALHRIRPKTSAWPTSLIAWPRSSTRSAWDDRTWSGCRLGVWLSSSTGGIPAVPSTLVLVSAYAGWAGSLPAEIVEQRLQQALRLADLPGDQLAGELVPTMFTASTPAELVEEFAASMSEFHPVGFRASARAFAEADVRDVLPRITVPTLLLYGDNDVRAPLNVAEDLHTKIPGSRLVVMEGVGHICNVEAAERFNTEVRAFLQSAQI